MVLKFSTKYGLPEIIPMGLKFDYLKDQEERKKKMATFIADKRYYLSRDGKKVTSDVNDPQADRLLLAQGDEMPEAEARKYGLIKDPEPEVASEAKQEAKQEIKAVTASPANKAVTPASTKIENK